MKTLYTDMNIRFQIEKTEILVLNIVFERLSHCIPKHSHGNNCYELHYIPYGYGTLIAAGKTYKITPDTLYITGPHVEHEQYPETANPMAEYCLYFKIRKGEKSRENLLKVFEETPFWFGKDTQDIRSNMHMIFQELEKNYTGYMIQVETLLQQCIIKLLRNYEYRKMSRKHFAPSNLTERKYIITEEYFLYEYQTLSLDNLAKRLGLSVRQTNRFLKECYGKNFQQKKAEAKMSAAAILLNDKTRTATEVAMELNYSSLEHFSAAFRRYNGVTIRQYRKEKPGKERSADRA